MERPVVIELAEGAMLRLPHAVGAEIRCVAGALWITHDHCRADIVLQGGERYVARRRAMLLQAMSFARLTIVPAEQRTIISTWVLSPR
jgi:hypothetical protein